MNPLVTVVLDTYNHEQFIEDAIRSALNQDFPRSQMEILVVDDGSTDRTPEIVRKFEPQVRLIRKPNGGQASAINAGIAHATGEIVAFLDGDDVWLPNKVSRVVEEFHNNPRVVLVYHKFSFWDSRDGREWDPAWLLVSGDIVADRRKLQIYSPSPAPTSSLAFRKSCLDRLTPIPDQCSFMHDAYLTGTAIFLGPVSTIADCLTKNRVHGNNLWYTDNDRPDKKAWRRRTEARHAAIESTRAWMLANVPAPLLPKTREFLLLSELASEADDFLLKPPGRLRLARHLLQRAWHYGVRMTWRHKLVTYVNAFGVLFTGYRRFYLLDQWRIRIKNALLGQDGLIETNDAPPPGKSARPRCGDSS
ncbi:MAG: glycosyltransferase family 2 protein [Candidatus Acidiferrales bacterium]